MGKQRILFVDDMKEVRDKIAGRWANNLYEIDYASNEKEALEKLKNNNYHSVITDYDLNGDSHKEGLNIIKAAKEKGIEVMLISKENHEQEALEAGAYKFEFKKDFLEFMKK